MAYFTPPEFDPTKTYDDPAEHSNQLLRDANNLASRQMPLKDHTFEEWKWRFHHRIQRPQRLLQKMKLAPVTATKDTTTIDSEDDGLYF